MDKLIPLAEAAGKGLALLIILLLTRLLSIEDYGTFNYVLSVVVWMSVFMDGGLNTLVFTKSVQGQIRDVEVYFNGRLLLSAIAALMFLSGLIVMEVKNVEQFALYVAFVFLSSTVALFKMIARGMKNTALDIQCVLLEPGLRTILLVAFTLIGVSWQLDYVYCVFLLSAAIVFVALFYRVHHVYDIKISLRSARNTILETLMQSRYYLVYYFVLVGIQRIDFVMINASIGEYGVALYSAAYNIYAAIQIVLSAYVMTKIKHIIDDPDSLGKVRRELFAYGVLCIIGIYVGSEYIIKIIYPQEYIEANGFLKILIVALPFYLLAYASIFLINHVQLVRVNALVIGLLFLFKWVILYVLDLSDVVSYVYVAATFEASLGLIYFLLVRHMNIPNLLTSKQ